jgi:hypothetical protein
MASITLPRPSRKGILDNIIDLILVQKNQVNDCRQRREETKEGESRA